MGSYQASHGPEGAPVRFPAPLRSGDTVAITAPSSGVEPSMHRRLDLVLEHLRSRGYRVIEGECLRVQTGGASAPMESRAAELERFLTDPEVAAVIPPWGGELAAELLDRIDFVGLRNERPTWLLGYSDISTLMMPLTLVSRWATAHGPCLMGRSARAESPASEPEFNYVDALRRALGSDPFPVLFDVDIGHKAPQFTLVNGAMATVRFDGAGGTITQVP